MNPTTQISPVQHLIASLSEQITTLTRSLSSALLERPHSLAEIEHLLIPLLKQIGSSLLSGVCSLLIPQQPEPAIACPCGALARFQRLRSARVLTLLGPLEISRPYYLCPVCAHGQHPIDDQLQFCAGSRSAALDELLALLGATQTSFAQAAQILERLTLLSLSPNSIRDATEQLGSLLLEQPSQACPQALCEPCPQDVCAPLSETSCQAGPSRLYITMDGVLVHLRQRGWSEVKVGCCYRTSTRRSRSKPEQLDIRAHSHTYLSSMAQAGEFGWELWEEAVRREVLQAEEVVVLGDGAAWIWAVAERHFPQATQVLDWYHASGYVWRAAQAIWNEQQQRKQWAEHLLSELWAGNVVKVLGELEQHRAAGEEVAAAVSYYSNNQARMQYAAYRERGLQVGSGNVESACKQVVTARLKGAGKIWSEEGAGAVAEVRAWLLSERWEEAIALRGVRKRRYRRKGKEQQEEEAKGAKQAEQQQEQQEQTREQEGWAGVLEQVRAELAQERVTHPWERAWSIRRQREQVALRESASAGIAA